MGDEPMPVIVNHIMNETIDDYLADVSDFDPAARAFLSKVRLACLVY